MTRILLNIRRTFSLPLEQWLSSSRQCEALFMSCSFSSGVNDSDETSTRNLSRLCAREPTLFSILQNKYSVRVWMGNTSNKRVEISNILWIGYFQVLYRGQAISIVFSKASKIHSLVFSSGASETSRYPRITLSSLFKWRIITTLILHKINIFEHNIDNRRIIWP